MTTPESTTSARGPVPTALDPSAINVVLATDCGSTTTKAILIERQRGDKISVGPIRAGNRKGYILWVVCINLLPPTDDQLLFVGKGLF